MTHDSAGLREWGHLLGATLFVTLLYLLLQHLELEMMAAAERRGWFAGNAAESLADEARQVAEHSAPIEGRLDPRHREFAWLLGLRLGYASEVLGSFGFSDPSVQARMRQSIAGILNDAGQLGAALGVGPVDVLTVRTAQEFADLRHRIERDELGIGARIEAHTTPRARHLFLLGMHVGVEMASLDSNFEMVAAPAGKEIAYHAVLSGVPETLWRPLIVVSGDGKPEAKAAYQQAATAMDHWLGKP